MFLEEKYRLLFFKYLCILIDINKYEMSLIDNGVEYINDKNIMCREELTCSKYSKYFYLLNKVDITKLNVDELNYLQTYNADESITEDIIRFLESTYTRVLLSDVGDIYYGPMMNDDFKAKSTDIVLGIKFDEFGLSRGILKDIDDSEKQSMEVSKIVELIENNNNIPIRVIKYNELFERLNDDNTISNTK